MENVRRTKGKRKRVKIKRNGYMRGNGLGNKGKIEHDASACIATLLAQQKENASAAKGTDIVKLVHK